MPEIPGGDLEPTAPHHDAPVKQEDIVAIQRLLEELEVKVDAATSKNRRRRTRNAASSGKDGDRDRGRGEERREGLLLQAARIVDKDIQLQVKNMQVVGKMLKIPMEPVGKVKLIFTLRKIHMEPLGKMM